MIRRSLLSAFALLLSIPGMSSGTPLIVPVAEDAAVLFRNDAPGVQVTNFNNAPLFSGGWEIGPGLITRSRSLFKFQLPALPPNPTLQSAIFSFALAKEGAQFGTHELYLVDDNWAEGSVTWISAPQLSPLDTPFATFNDSGQIPGVGAWTTLDFDVTALVLAEYQTDQTLSILWRESTEDGTLVNRLRGFSNQTAVIDDQRARLTLTFVPEPATLPLACLALLFVVASRKASAIVKW